MMNRKLTNGAILFLAVSAPMAAQAQFSYQLTMQPAINGTRLDIEVKGVSKTPGNDDASKLIAGNEARADALGKARQRADVYAKAAGMHVKRIISINEHGDLLDMVASIAALSSSIKPKKAGGTEAAASGPSPDAVLAMLTGGGAARVIVTVSFELE